MERKKASHPAWALACKRKGTELRLLGGKYYLYEVSSKWNPEKKRSVAVADGYFGAVYEGYAGALPEADRVEEKYHGNTYLFFA
jgi:hypothetical protein